MNQAIENLMSEHRFIEQVLASLHSFIQTVGPSDRLVVRRYAEFFRLFADKFHHGKEEDRLFVVMGDFGFPKHAGPIAVMLSEHTEGRRHVSALFEIGQAEGPLSDEQADAVAEHAEAFIPLLSGHIHKEDSILYPMALRALPADRLDKLSAECEAFERDTIGPAESARLLALGNQLIADYPPFTQSECDPMCAGCSG